MRQLLLESELHSLAAVQAAQAEHWNGLRDAVQDSVDLWQGDVEAASGCGAVTYSRVHGRGRGRGSDELVPLWAATGEPGTR